MRCGRVLRGTGATLLVAGATAFVPAVAHAATFCVHQAGACAAGTTDEGGDLQKALDDAGAASGSTVTIGPGTYVSTGPSGFDYAGPTGKVTIVGAGSGSGGTVLQAPGQSTVLRVMTGSTASAVSDLAIGMSAVNNQYGISAKNVAISHIAVTSPGGAPDQHGADLGAGVSLMDSRIDVSASPDSAAVYLGVGTVGDPAVIARDTLVGETGVNGGQAVVDDARITATVYGLITAGDVTLDDSVIELAPGHLGPWAILALNGATVTARSDTLLGGSIQFAIAGEADSQVGQPTALNVLDTVVEGFGETWAAVKTGANATVTVHDSDFPAGREVQANGGVVTVTDHNVDVPPGFVDAANHDYHLRFDSLLVDAGGTCGAACLATPDLDGLARPIDGDGNGTATRDIGAYEYGHRAPTVAPANSAQVLLPGFPASQTSVKPGDTVTFTAHAADADAGDPLTIAWTFDDGTTAAGESVTHAFTTSGPHTASVTATDPRQLTATGTTTVQVDDPAPAPTPTVTTTPLITPPPDVTAPSVTHFAASPSQFKLSAKTTATSAATHRVHAGTTLTFTLSERAAVKVSFALHKPAAHHRTTVVTVGSLRRGTEAAGADRIAFSGRLGSKVKLRPGTYTATITATDPAGNHSRAKTATFKVVSS